MSSRYQSTLSINKPKQQPYFWEWEHPDWKFKQHNPTNCLDALPKEKEAVLERETTSALERGVYTMYSTTGRFVRYAAAWARAKGRTYEIIPRKIGFTFLLH